jgi:competence protein ComEA
MPAIAPSRIAAAVAVLFVVGLVGWNSLRSEQSGHEFPAAAGTGPASIDPGESGGPDGPASLRLNPGSSAIVVDVSGAVRRPGVYRFEDGDRVIDAIRRAGGATRDAFAAGINRAALLADGQQVVVPLGSDAVGPTAAGAGMSTVPGTPAAPGAADAPISLGTATAAELDQIEGIGPVTAAAILEFRDSQGGVSSIDELDQVSGIGPVTMEALRSRLQP